MGALGRGTWRSPTSRSGRAFLMPPPPIMFFDHVARMIGAELGEVLEVDSDREGRIWGESIRVRVKHDVDEPLRSQLEFHDHAENEVYFLNVKYERLPRFCCFCGYLGLGQRECKLSADLQKMRFSVALRASPFKRSSTRGGFVVPEGSSARRFLIFESDTSEKERRAPVGLPATRYRDIPKEVINNPLVQAAIDAVCAIKIDTVNQGEGSQGHKDTVASPAEGRRESAGDGVGNNNALSLYNPADGGVSIKGLSPEFPPGIEPMDMHGQKQGDG